MGPLAWLDFVRLGRALPVEKGRPRGPVLVFLAIQQRGGVAGFAETWEARPPRSF